MMDLHTSTIEQRRFSTRDVAMLTQQGLDPVLARIFAARGITHRQELETDLKHLLPPTHLLGIEQAATLLADTILQQKKMLVIADYDCDGATACAVAVRGIRLLTQGCQLPTNLDYLVPNRFEYGYGLTPEIVELAAKHPAGKPDLLITVDNGIASIEGVNTANTYGIDVLVTDHHLPGDRLPDARCIVNPNQPNCPFESKNLAGVGVMFYVLLALRAELRKRQAFKNTSEPRLDCLLDLVALGTVADVVKLDKNNRTLVAQGLHRIRKHSMHAGIAALLHIAGRNADQITAMDLGFAIGPRINAAGRLADMSMGIACLLTDNYEHALTLATQLDNMNRERRVIEADMQEQALANLDTFSAEGQFTVCAFHHDWHQGVIGIVASRLRERFNRPTIVFAPGGDDIVKGSGRSIPGFHLRDALDLVYKRHPSLIQKFGGHAMAAGLSLAKQDLPQFMQAFEETAQTLLDPEQLQRRCHSDGALSSAHFTPQFATQLNQYIWGQGFPAPIFEGTFDVVQQTLLKEKHLRLTLAHGQQRLQAIWFNHNQTLPSRVHLAYRLDLNRYNGSERVQILIEEACASHANTIE